MGLKGRHNGIEGLDLGFNLLCLGFGKKLADLRIELDYLGLNLVALGHELSGEFLLLKVDFHLDALELELLEGGFGIGQGWDLVGTWVDFVDALDFEGLEPDFSLDVGHIVARDLMGTFADGGRLGHALAVRDDIWVSRGDDEIRIRPVVFLINVGIRVAEAKFEGQVKGV